MKNNVCVFDLDNTLYDFVDFFAPAFRGMITAISKKTKIDKDILIENAATVLNKYGFLEYPFLIREMHVFLNYNNDEILKLEKLASSVFGRIRKNRLVLYPDMERVISELYKGGIDIVAVTNAPLFQAYRRLEALKLIKYFSVIVAVDNIEIPEYIFIKGKSKEPWLKRNGLEIVTFRRSEGKPSEHPYKLLQKIKNEKKQLWVIGDNIGRDLEPASNLGFRTIWARYGCQIEKKNYDTVLNLTPPEVKKHEIAKSSYKPDYIIETPSELLNIIPYTKQLSLFDDEED
jgi:FMN phosphatase YigB (HAD superfamily)